VVVNSRFKGDSVRIYLEMSEVWSVITDDSVINSILDLSLEMLTSPSGAGVDVMDRIREICETSGSLKSNHVKIAVNESSKAFEAGMMNGWSSQLLSTNLVSEYEMPELVAKLATKKWAANRGRITMSSLSKTLKANQLVDMDWSFGVTASNDSYDEIGKTFLQLKLTFDRDVGVHGRFMFLELTVDQFFQFLSSLEKCKQYLEVCVATK
jgi:hypothetical protein